MISSRFSVILSIVPPEILGVTFSTLLRMIVGVSFALNFFAKPEVEHISKWVRALYSDIRDMSDEKTAAAFLNNPNPNIQKFTSGLKKLGIK